MTLSGQTYTAAAGETFDSISMILYGDEKYAAELLNANPKLCRIFIFSGGEELEIPIIEVADDEDEEEIMPATAPWKSEEDEE